jgi:hypothetical protein
MYKGLSSFDGTVSISSYKGELSVRARLRLYRSQ